MGIFPILCLQLNSSALLCLRTSFCVLAILSETRTLLILHISWGYLLELELGLPISIERHANKEGYLPPWTLPHPQTILIEVINIYRLLN